MNKKELIAKLADKADLSQAKASEVVDAMTTIISKVIAKGGDVRLVGFGTFTVVHRKATEGRHPRTGAPINIPAMTKPKFRPGLSLTEAVNKNRKK